MEPNDKKQDESVKIERTNIERKEQPGMVGATFIKYAAYIIILLIVLYFIVNYLLPRI
jgi:hypothetical protein